MAEGKILAAVMIKSPIGSKPDARMTLRLLGFHRLNACVLLANTPSYTNMLQIAKDYVTWGLIDAPFATKVLEERGKMEGDKPVATALAKKAAEGLASGGKLLDFEIKRHLRLHPPAGGFKRTLKRQVSSKGECGDRGDKMQALLERMI
jgi:large subunit ribosomal protein L30